MDIVPFLRRIRFDGPVHVSPETLARLQEAFLLSVPFENLDIHLGRPISLERADIQRKIVGRRRGGFCYECNIVFNAVLHEIGFPVRMVSARMAGEDGFAPEFDHMALLVGLDGGDVLVDVGNGQSARVPLRLDGSDESRAEGIDYRVGRHGSGFALLHRKPDDHWEPRYLFDTTARKTADFADMCRHHQTSPDSVFTGQRFVTMATPTGRVTLAGLRLSVEDGATRTETTLATEDGFLEALDTHFGIESASL